MSTKQHSPMVVRVARALCKRNSALCNVNDADNWKVYGEAFLADAEAAVSASGAPDLLEALDDMSKWVAAFAYGNGSMAYDEVMRSPRMKKASAAIARANAVTPPTVEVIAGCNEWP